MNPESHLPPPPGPHPSVALESGVCDAIATPPLLVFDFSVQVTSSLSLISPTGATPSPPTAPPLYPLQGLASL